jgi:putative phosphoribosyl transferase
VIFHDRRDAGQQLAAKLLHIGDRNPVVLALPRGGVPVGYEIARALKAPLDVVLVRKIGVPWQPELALGAVADGGDPDVFIDRDLIAELSIPEEYIVKETFRQIEEIERRRRIYGAGRAPIEIAGRPAIVVDDGIATGATMRVALQATRRRNPAWLILAAPVAAEDTLSRLRPYANEVIYLQSLDRFGAVGAFYRDFHQLSDTEVTRLLVRAAQLMQ